MRLRLDAPIKSRNRAGPSAEERQSQCRRVDHPDPPVRLRYVQQMSSHRMRRIAIVFLWSASLVSFSSTLAWTQEHQEPAPPKASPPTVGSQSDSLPPLPKDASVSQSVTV